MKELWTAICNNFGVIVGVLGSLGGTILGWWLNNISKRGTLTIKTTHNEMHLQRKNRLSGGDPHKKDGELTWCKETFFINLYNNSGEIKTIRDIFVVFKDALGNELLRCKAKDSSTTRQYGGIWQTEPISVVNISGKTGIDIDSSYGTHEIEALLKAQSAFLEYKDEKFKVKQIKMWDYDYSTIPLFEENNKE